VTTWTIRPATRRDVAPLLTIEDEQFPEPWTRKMLIEEITNRVNRRYSVATDQSGILGYCGAMFVELDMHLNTIGVRRSVEGRGVATSLLVELWAAAKARGMTRATLEVAVSNERALALYRRFGFAPVGVRTRYYQKTGEDALVCWADIGGDVPSVTP
jgi:[ribosomal protein S18]-alanine N-acetyltransferase